MNTMHTRTRWLKRIRALLWLPALVPVLLSGCKSEPANFTMVKTAGTNMTIMVTPDSVSNPVTLTIPNPISVNVTNVERERLSPCAHKVVTMPRCPVLQAHCPPWGYGMGKDSKPDVLTRGNLLTLLALLVALSAYLANVRNNLNSKREKAREKIEKAEKEAKEPATAATCAEEIKRCEARISRINEHLHTINNADKLMVFAVVFIGLYVFGSEFIHCELSTRMGYLRLFGMLFSVVAIAYLIFLHFMQWQKERERTHQRKAPKAGKDEGA